MATGMKVLVVGPSRSHKSAMCTFLGSLSENISGAPDIGSTVRILSRFSVVYERKRCARIKYVCVFRVQVGARILEADKQGTPVEIWDVAGDQAFENAWPAIQKDASGVVIVFSPETAGSAVCT
jgi:GTPase SAR1 family protein